METKFKKGKPPAVEPEAISLRKLLSKLLLFLYCNTNLTKVKLFLHGAPGELPKHNLGGSYEHTGKAVFS